MPEENFKQSIEDFLYFKQASEKSSKINEIYLMLSLQALGNNEKLNKYNERSVLYDSNENIQTVLAVKRKKGSKKEPLPMKLRALPQSFWQQPNEPAQQAPGTICPDLPIICANGDVPENEDSSNSTPLVIPRTYCIAENVSHEEVVSTANTELLFSLFSVIERNEINNNNNKRRMTLVRRGRTKKLYTKGILRDADPCLISTVTEALLPLLPDREKKLKYQKQALVTFSVDNSERTPVTASTSLTTGHSYNSHLLSEVVVRL